MPQLMPLNIYRGDCYARTFTFWTDEAATLPYDMTGATAQAEIRAKPGSPVLATLECTVTQPNAVDIYLDADQSATLPVGKAAWDLQLTYPDGCVQTVVGGPVAVTADVTASAP